MKRIGKYVKEGGGNGMDRNEVLDLLKQENIDYLMEEHPAIETIQEMERLALLNSETIVKNIFLRDDKKRNYYLLIVEKSKQINLKELRKLLNARPLTFASEKDLFDYLGLVKGAVTPLGLLNDTTNQVQLVIDEEIKQFATVGVHPIDNEATVWLALDDLHKIIKKNGNEIRYISLK